MKERFQDHLRRRLDDIEAAGLFKAERTITSAQGPVIAVNGRRVLNFCANNYLGLADHPELIHTACEAMTARGYGMSSVRFICGTQDLHRQLEDRISNFFGTESTLLYASCFDANGGVFEPLFSEEDAIISDALNHASIIDGIRLSRARRVVYRSGDMIDLEDKLREAASARFRIIVTDGVFSMDGHVAPLDRIMKLALKYDALVLVDESHSAGVVGESGRGATELFNIRGRVDIITGTLGKAFGGAVGGFTTGRREIIELLRQRSRPYLFSNSLPPAIVAAAVRMFDLIEKDPTFHGRLRERTRFFVAGMRKAGFNVKPTDSAICAVMLHDARLAGEFSERLLEEGIYVIGFSYPVVPKGQARIRVQISAAHSREHLSRALEAFARIGRELGVVA